MNILSKIALYRESVNTRREQFVGYLDKDVIAVRADLQELGFTESGRTCSDEQSSWFLFEDQYMLHVMLYAGHPSRDVRNDHAYVFAHMEPRIDTEPVKHLLRRDVNGPRGVNRVRTLLNKHGINYYNDIGIRD